MRFVVGSLRRRREERKREGATALGTNIETDIKMFEYKR